MKKATMKLFLIAVMLTLLPVTGGCNLFSSTPTPDYESLEPQLVFMQTPEAESIPFDFEYAPTETLEPEFTETPLPEDLVTPDPLFAMPSAGAIPTTYTLQSGEFPYCIARRFNVHPRDLLTLNNLSAGQGQIYQPGLVLSIPQSGRPFPPPRALRPHPATYTVSESHTTINKVACYYGDVEPDALMQYNGLTSPILTVGTILQIP